METSAVAASTTAMEDELARLTSCVVVACLCNGRGDVEPAVIKRGFCSRFGVLQSDVKVVRHRPEDFLIIFKYLHHRDAAVAMPRLPIGDLDVRIMPWRVLPHGEHCDLRYHVRFCLEGIPAHAWNESIAKRAVARACDLDYVEQKSLRRDDTRALCLWAWTHNPSDIPRLTWLTLTGNSTRVHDGLTPPRGRHGVTFRVIVHLDLVEAPPDEHGRAATKKHSWHYGIIDGQRVPPPIECTGGR